MFSEPRTISLVSEFIHVPTQHTQDNLRSVYNEVCRTCGYENFMRVQGGARIERRSPESEGFSQLTILGDRIQMIDDHTGVTAEQFSKKAIEVLRILMPTLGVPIILVQQTKVRMTSSPGNYRTAAEFLARRLFQVSAQELEPLGRPTSVFGFRLVFPATKEHSENFNVRIESYVRDATALYIENTGTFKTPIQLAGLEQVEKNLNDTSDFVSENLVNFLSTYDRKRPAEDDA